MSGKADPDLHLCVETLFTTVDGREVLCRRGTNWRGRVVDLHPEFFVDAASADEPTIAARAARCRRWPSLEPSAWPPADGPCVGRRRDVRHGPPGTDGDGRQKSAAPPRPWQYPPATVEG